MTDDLADLTYDTFSPHVNEQFKISDGAREYDATLLRCDELEYGQKDSRIRQKGFTLLFRAQAESPQVQQIYRVIHPRIGTHDVFLVPVHLSEEGLEYEAVFI